jgi:hypothetical protein
MFDSDGSDDVFVNDVLKEEETDDDTEKFDVADAVEELVSECERVVGRCTLTARIMLFPLSAT